MKHSFYVVAIVTLFVGFGLNGTDNSKRQYDALTYLEILRLEVELSTEDRLLLALDQNFNDEGLNRTKVPNIELKRLKEYFNDEMLKLTNVPNIGLKALKQSDTSDQSGEKKLFSNTCKAASAVAVVAFIYYFRDEINHTLSWAANGALNGARSIRSFFIRSSQKSEKSK